MQNTTKTVICNMNNHSWHLHSPSSLCDLDYLSSVAILKVICIRFRSHQQNNFYYFQDDFLDLADDTHHVQAAEMALCLSPTTGSSATGTTTMTCPKTVTASDDLQHVNQLVDNPVMKLDNLDSWDQDV